MAAQLYFLFKHVIWRQLEWKTKVL